MDVTEALDAMRSDIPGCSLLAFTDLGSRLVLCTSAASKPAQEDLDKLSELAQMMLSGPVSEGALPALAGEGGDVLVGSAMLMSDGDVKVFLRASAEAQEALVCVCAPETDLAKVVDCGRSTLDTIVAKT